MAWFPFNPWGGQTGGGGGGEPTGPAGGDLGGTYPDPTVTRARGLRTSGGTTLAMLSPADSEILARAGSNVTGVAIGTGAGTVASGPAVATAQADATTALANAATALTAANEADDTADAAQADATSALADAAAAATAASNAQTSADLALGAITDHEALPTGTAHSGLMAALDYGEAGDLTTITPDDAADAGTGDEVARATHRHAIAAGTPVAIGAANAEGAGTGFARDNHVHDHGAQTTATHHAVASASANGFMAAADYTKLAGLRVIASGSTSAGATSETVFATLTRNANERVIVLGWMVADVVGLSWAHDVTLTAAGVVLFFERTATADQFELRAGNASATARTLEWVVLGYTP